MWGKCQCPPIQQSWEIKCLKVEVAQLTKDLDFQKSMRDFDSRQVSEWVNRLKQEFDAEIVKRTTREEELHKMLARRSERILELEREAEKPWA